MPHVVEISDSTFRRLQAIARPLIDTPSSVIDALVEHYETTKPNGSVGTTSKGAPASRRSFDPGNPPPLTHTKLLSASFGSVEIDRPKWNELVRKSLELAFAKANDFDEVRRISGANIIKGLKTDEGYSPLGTLGVSVQGVDAHDAWRIAYSIAKKLGVSIEIGFEWRDKEGAAYPGEVGTIAWHPPANGSR